MNMIELKKEMKKQIIKKLLHVKKNTQRVQSHYTNDNYLLQLGVLKKAVGQTKIR